VAQKSTNKNNNDDFSSKVAAKGGDTSRILSSPLDIKLFTNMTGDREVSNASTVADYDFDCDTILYMVYCRRPSYDDSDDEEDKENLTQYTMCITFMISESIVFYSITT